MRRGAEVRARGRGGGSAVRPEPGAAAAAVLLGCLREEHMLLLTMHHIVSDGWSMGVLARRVDGALQRLRGGAVAAEPLPIQYADYAALAAEWLRGEALEQELAYWRERLEGAPARAGVADRPRGRRCRRTGARCTRLSWMRS